MHDEQTCFGLVNCENDWPFKKKRFWLGESLNRGLSLTMEIELARKRATIYP